MIVSSYVNKKTWHGPLRSIQLAACKEFGVSMVDINSRRRDQATVVVRHISMWLCRVLTNTSYPVLGQQFNNRDHTTIIHGVRNAEKLLAQDSSLMQKANKIIKAYRRGN